MLRVRESESATAAVHYLREGLNRDDYYIKGQELPAQWLGKGAEKLGLSGAVEEEDFVALVRNRDPGTGKRLTPRDKSDRRPGYDATLSAWKSASVMDGLYGCTDIREAFWAAGDDMMTHAAEPEMRTRVRTRGQDSDRVTGNMICGAFRHLRSRPVNGRSDMHLHTHYYVLNGTFDSVEKKWKAAQLGDLKAKAPDLELDFDARFAKKLRALGYVPVMGKTGVQIAGVPQSVIDKFSQRRNQIEKKAAELGVSDAKGKHKIGVAIRESKKSDLPADKLMADWKSRLTPGEEAALEKVRDKQVAQTKEISAREAVDYAVNHLFQREDVVTERKLRKTAVHYGIGYVTRGEVDREISGALERREILMKEGKKGRQFVKASTLRDQCRMTQLARDGRGVSDALVMAYVDVSELSAEQNAAARLIAESRDRYMGLRGPAGTGKSYTLRAVDGVIRERAARGETRYTRALALAPSSSASRGELRKAGFKDATTLAAFLDSEKMQRSMQDQLLIVDEAGMMSTKDMIGLMEVAQRNNNRVWFVGDYRQHTSVDAGDAFRLLQAEGGLKYAALTENRRQQDADYRKAVDLIESGVGEKALKGMKLLDSKGWIVEIPDAAGRQNFLVGKYLKAADEGASALIVGTTNREGEEITQRLREELKARGKITGEERAFPSRVATNWTDAQKRDSRNYEPGMVVEFHKAVPGVRQSVKGSRETNGGFKQGETAVVMRAGTDVVLLRGDGSSAPLPADHAERFQIYRTGEQNIARGDQIRLTKNGMVKVKGQALGTRVNNGDIFPVAGFTKEGDIRLPGGKLLPKQYGHFALGYTDTSQRSQSKTVDRVLIAVDPHAPKATNHTQWYVSLSRGRDLGMAVVADKKSAMDAVKRGGERLSALELMKSEIGREEVTHQRRFGLAKLLERNRIGRYLKARADAVREAARGVIKGLRNRGGIQYA